MGFGDHRAYTIAIQPALPITIGPPGLVLWPGGPELHTAA